MKQRRRLKGKRVIPSSDDVLMGTGSSFVKIARTDSCLSLCHFLPVSPSSTCTHHQDAITTTQTQCQFPVITGAMAEYLIMWAITLMKYISDGRLDCVLRQQQCCVLATGSCEKHRSFFLFSVGCDGVIRTFQWL